MPPTDPAPTPDPNAHLRVDLPEPVTDAARGPLARVMATLFGRTKAGPFRPGGPREWLKWALHAGVFLVTVGGPVGALVAKYAAELARDPDVAAVSPGFAGLMAAVALALGAFASKAATDTVQGRSIPVEPGDATASPRDPVIVAIESAPPE